MERKIKVELTDLKDNNYYLLHEQFSLHENAIVLSNIDGEIKGDPFYISSDEIVYYMIDNRYNGPPEGGSVKIGSKEDVFPPKPTSVLFHNLLILKNGLFTQEEYVEYCIKYYKENCLNWYNRKTSIEKRGLEKKLRWNFYRSFIDELHIQSLLIETGKFIKTIKDPVIDYAYKVDILAYNYEDELPLKFDVQTNSKKAREDAEYKKNNRGKDCEAILLTIPDCRGRKPKGGKIWFEEKDLFQIPNFDKLKTIEIKNQINKQKASPKKLKKGGVGTTYTILNLERG